MDLDRGSLLRLQEFVGCVNRTMNAVPLPVPPWPEGTWDGDVLLARELHLAYSRLPEPLQDAAAYGYAQCLYALEVQTGAAREALVARYAVFADLSRRVGLTPDEMCPELRCRGERPYLTLVRDPDRVEPIDDDEALRQLVLATVAARIGAVPEPADPEPADPEPADSANPEPDRAADRAEPVAGADSTASPLRAPAVAAAEPAIAEAAPVSCRVPVMIGASAGLAVAAALAVAVWPRAAHTPTAMSGPDRLAAPLECEPAAPAGTAFAPAGTTFAIDRAATDGDLAVVVSHGERVGVRTRYHVHMVNAGEQPHRADITIHHGDRDTPAASEMIPPRSSRHRVIEVAEAVEAGDDDVSLSIGAIRVDDVPTGQ